MISKAVILQVLEKSAISACVGVLGQSFGQRWALSFAILFFRINMTNTIHGTS